MTLENPYSFQTQSRCIYWKRLNMNKHTNTKLLLLALSLLVSNVKAQTPSKQDEVIALPEFTVTNEDNSWVASNALSGTRTNTALRDLPRSIQVVTSEFLNDLGALTLTDATDYISGVTNVGSQDQTNDGNTYQVRGFRQNKLYHDGQREPFAGMLYDAATLDRVEIIKGPSSVLAGLAEPGGAINSVSKLPRSRKSAKFKFSTDGWGMRRAELDANLPINQKLAFRFVWVRQQAPSWIDQAWANRTVYYGAVSYKLNQNTTYTGNLEYFDYIANPPAPRSTIASTSPLIGLTWHNNGAINGLNLNGVDIPWNFNPLGPNNRRIERILRASSQIQHRFNSVFSSRFAVNASKMHRTDLRLSGTQISTGVNATTGKVTPTTDALSSTNDVETVPTYSAQVDLVAKLKYFGITQQSVLEGEYIDSDDVRNRDNTPALTAYVFGATYQPAYDQMLDKSRYTLPQNRLNNKMHRRAIALTNIFGAFNDRLHVLAGIRHDEGTIVLSNPIATTAIGKYQKLQESSNSPNLGAVFAVTKDLSVYTSSSRSFAGVPQSSIDMFGNPLTKQVEGKGYDVGIKSGFLNDRINVNAAAFVIDQQNIVRQVSTSEITAAGLDPLVVTGARSIQDQSAEARGWETDITLKVTKDYQVAVTYTNLHAFVTAAPNAPSTVGGPVSQGPGRESWSIFHKYNLPGFLKDFTVTHSVVFRDSRRPTVPGFTRQDAGISYHTEFFKKKTVFTLNERNLTNVKYWEGFQARGAPRTLMFSGTITF